MNFENQKPLNVEELESVSEKLACALGETEFSSAETNARRRRDTPSRDGFSAAVRAQSFDF